MNIVLNNLYENLRHVTSREMLLAIYAAQKMWMGEPNFAVPIFGLSKKDAESIAGKRFESYLPWELIGILTLYWEAHDNLTDSVLKTKKYDILNINAFNHLVNGYRKITNDQSMDDVIDRDKSASLFEMISRIMWQQFIWQEGHDRPDTMLRYSYINYTDSAKNVFFERYGLDADKFFTISFMLKGHFNGQPFLNGIPNLEYFGISRDNIKKYFSIVSLSTKEASKLASKLGGKSNKIIEFKSSFIYDYPIINIGDHLNPIYMCPFPELILYRATYFMSLDIISASGDRSPKALRKKASRAKLEMDKAFESYCALLAKKNLSTEFDVVEDFTYGKVSNQQHTPDVLLIKGNTVLVAIECKSKKMKIDVRTSARPAADFEAEIKDIAYGVLQLWRFYRDLRNGLVVHGGANYLLGDNFAPVIVTLEEWMDHSPILIQKCMSIAADLNIALIGTPDHIPEEFTIDVCFLSAKEYERAAIVIRPDCFIGYLNSYALHQKNINVEGFSVKHLERSKTDRKNAAINELIRRIPLVPEIMHKVIDDLDLK